MAGGRWLLLWSTTARPNRSDQKQKSASSHIDERLLGSGRLDRLEYGPGRHIPKHDPQSTPSLR